MQLDVPLFRQNEDSSDCGPTCLRMLLAYHGQTVSYNDIASSFVHVNSGVGIAQLGRYMLEKGFDAEIVLLNPHIFSFDMQGLSDQALIKQHLIDRKAIVKTDDHKIVAQHLIDFIDKGGTYRLKVPDADDIKYELSQKRPLISLMTTRYLHGLTGFNFHFNVITGLSGDMISVNDPAWDICGGQHTLLLDTYLYAMHASAFGDLDNDSLLLIKPRL